MSFKEFDLTDYIEALEKFKLSNTDHVVKHWGSVENFDLFIQRVKDREPEIAKSAIKYYGSVEKYTELMKQNLENFSEIINKEITGKVEEIGQQSDELYTRLTADLSKDCSSDEIQGIVQEIVDFIKSTGVSLDKPFWEAIIHSLSNDYIKTINDKKYGEGASDYIVKAFQCYGEAHFA